MNEFLVRPRSHASLQDYIAADKGYFEDEGLDNLNIVKHSFDGSSIQGADLPEQKTGAYDVAAADPSKAEERTNLNTFCHWAVNRANWPACRWLSASARAAIFPRCSRWKNI
jgi:hypothetical protein